MEWDHWPNQGYPCKYCQQLGHDEEECPKKEIMAVDYSEAARIMNEKIAQEERDMIAARRVEEKIRWIVRDEVKNLFKEGELVATKIRNIQPERRPVADADLRHTAIVLPRTGVGPGATGGFGVGPGSDRVPEGSGEDKHRTRDRGEHTETHHADPPPKEINIDEDSSPCVGENDYVRPALHPRRIAALLHATKFSSFGPTVQGNSANLLLGDLEDALVQQYPDWEEQWPASSK